MWMQLLLDSMWFVLVHPAFEDFNGKNSWFWKKALTFHYCIQYPIVKKKNHTSTKGVFRAWYSLCWHSVPLLSLHLQLL